jgi:hypothetical protein
MENFVLILMTMGILLSVGQVCRAAEPMRLPYTMVAAGPDPRCPPTPAEPLGPFYEPGAPERAKVGEGYLLRGTVKSSEDCRPISGAQIEFWLAGPKGSMTRSIGLCSLPIPQGGYTFESNFPPRYSVRPPHIHLRVTAPGRRTLVTQHYPVAGQKEGNFDLVLEPAGEGPHKAVK